MPAVQIGPISVGTGRPLALIAGPCLLESRELALRTAEALRDAAAQVGLPYIFKSSFDKANRTSGSSPRGPGLERGLRWLEDVRRELGVPVTTDVHEPLQARPCAEVVDLLQVPAFLCRQTDLLIACAETGKPVNIKKSQMLSAEEMRYALQKCRAVSEGGVLLTERGTFFGYHDLVVDMRNLPRLAALGAPVVFDATHSVQRPGLAQGSSGGERQLAPTLANAAIAAGADALFAEVHPDPAAAQSDAATQLPLDALPALLKRWARLAELVREPL